MTRGSISRRAGRQALAHDGDMTAAGRARPPLVTVADVRGALWSLATTAAGQRRRVVDTSARKLGRTPFAIASSRSVIMPNSAAANTATTSTTRCTSVNPCKPWIPPKDPRAPKDTISPPPPWKVEYNGGSSISNTARPE